MFIRGRSMQNLWPMPQFPLSSTVVGKRSRSSAGVVVPGLRVIAALVIVLSAVHSSAGWKRHVIDNASRGADGTRLQDVNGDGRPDIVTGWEQGNITRLMIHPGPERVHAPWPAVTVGKTPAVEDAVLADFDGDGALDVLSCCEGSAQQILVSWGPSRAGRLLEADAWETRPVAASVQAMRWMYALPQQIDGRHGLDFFAGGKSENGQIGWFESPADARKLEDWKWHPLGEVGWTMSLAASDMDADGDVDLVFSDRRGKRSGAYWLDNPGADVLNDRPWNEHLIGAAGREVMFLDMADLDGDGLQDVVVATKPMEVLWLQRLDDSGTRWKSHRIPFPEASGTAKAVSVGDIDLDGRLDLVVSCEAATAPLQGVSWLSYERTPGDEVWTAHEISGADGVKHDLVPLIDLDGDGDLDVVTSEEVRGLGVIWYENPARERPRSASADGQNAAR